MASAKPDHSGPLRWVRWIQPLISLGLFAAALWVIHDMLGEYHYSDVVGDLRRIAPVSVVVAAGVTLADYWAMSLYDVLAFRHIGRTLPYRRIAFSAFISYVFGNNVGLFFFGSGATRYRLYSAWGIPAGDTARVIAFCQTTFAMGFCALVGALLVADPQAIPAMTRLPGYALRPAGAVLLAVVAGYWLLARFRRRPLRIVGWTLRVPSLPMAMAQTAVAAGDWALASLVLYTLLPRGAHLPFLHFLPAFLLAEVAGFLSSVPAGLGVLDGVALALLSPAVPAPAVLGALVAYRVIFYVLPFLTAVVLLAGHEVLLRRRPVPVRQAGERAGASGLLPPVVAVCAFLAGAWLLLTGALPILPEGTWLGRVMPLPALELSHLAASMLGAALLVLAYGLGRRLRTAYVLSAVLLCVGAAAMLVRRFDYLYVLPLLVVLALLAISRRDFYRRGPILSGPLSVRWVIAVLVALVSFLWVGLLVYRGAGYSHDLWWAFSWGGHASRFLRATAAACVVTFALALAILLRTRWRPGPVAGRGDLGRVRAIVRGCPDTYANLALLGDKSFLFSASGDAFIMYGVQGQSWIAMGDPVGPEEQWQELVWQFRDLVDRYDGRTVFYEVMPDRLGIYLSAGLVPLNIGEEARVPLESFRLEGPARKGLRHGHRAAAERGCRVEVHPSADVPALVPELKDISDRWLARKHAREMGFTLGYFSPDYLARFRVAVVRREGRMVAFTNLWESSGREELSIDLMRHDPDEVHGLMDYLFAELMLWGRREGYRWFNLGTVPLAGLDQQRMAPLWNRFGGMIFRHGEHFYNFQGLRAYKDKFDPVWRPKYLVVPGGLWSLPMALVDLTTLSSGGVRRLVGG